MAQSNNCSGNSVEQFPPSGLSHYRTPPLQDSQTLASNLHSVCSAPPATAIM